MTPNAVPASTSSYALSSAPPRAEQPGIIAALVRLLPLMATERKSVTIACVAVIISSLAGLIGPLIIAHTIDTYIRSGDFGGVLRFASLLFVTFLASFVSTYVQTQTMGSVGRRVLFGLRNRLFTKIQDLPLDFFNQNKAGDLISRINNDTDKLNQFFAQSLVQLAANLFMMTGAAIFLVALDVPLGLVALAPAAGVFVLTRLTGSWVRQRNVKSLQSLGALSAEIQESLANFKVIVAFNRRDYFREKFDQANTRTFEANVASGLASTLFMPVYGFAYNLAQVLVLLYGIHLIATGSVTIGLLIAFLLYVNSFYLPLRQLAAVWASFQLALAGLDRISAVLALESNMPVLPAAADEAADARTALLEFDHVGFSYPGGREVLHDVSFALERGKTYALVGPTGGGKTTTAALMARLYDPTNGRVLLNGRDIRTYQPDERAGQIGFILQEPFLFTGTIRENIVYGNSQYADYSDERLMSLIVEHNLGELVARFDNGLETKVTSSGEAVSLGQKQLIAFMRAVLRDPEILVLDEATANVDTVTEQLLDDILAKLPSSTTKVIIAHRLNTIADADEIFFINAGTITPAGSMEHALEMLLHGKRDS
jgi:ATP-binding cassette, subfamily B, bacterial